MAHTQFSTAGHSALSQRVLGVNNPDPDLLTFDGVPQATPGGDLTRLGRGAVEGLAPAQAGLTRQVNALNDIESRKGEEEAVLRARLEAGKAVDRDAAQFERATRGFDLSDRQKGAAKSRIGLTRAIAQAERAGSTRRGFTNRAQAVRRASSGFADALFNQRLGAESDISNIFGQKESARLQRKADKKSSIIGGIGKLAGLAAMVFMSSEKVKDKHGAPRGLLAKLKDVRVENWNYKGDDVQHIGPYAEEFNETFGVGEGKKDKIHVIDMLGVTLGAVKELNARMDSHGT